MSSSALNGIRTIDERGNAVSVFASRTEALSASLTRRQAEDAYERWGGLQMAVVDTGENGVFTKGEFEAITHLRQMEAVTPEEIAR